MLTEEEIQFLLPHVDFGASGLIPAVAQNCKSQQVLMLAWMNRDALTETMRTGLACYWSRSRGKLWRKGERSGQTLRVREILLDCDGDALILQVEPKGVACHTGRRSCFFRRAKGSVWQTILRVEIDPAKLYDSQEDSLGEPS